MNNYNYYFILFSSNWNKLLNNMPIIGDYDVKNDLKNKESLEEREKEVNDSISLDDLKNSIDDTYKLFSEILENAISAMGKEMYIIF